MSISAMYRVTKSGRSWKYCAFTSDYPLSYVPWTVHALSVMFIAWKDEELAVFNLYSFVTKLGGSLASQTNYLCRVVSI